jgi:hypothetical protein
MSDLPPAPGPGAPPVSPGPGAAPASRDRLAAPAVIVGVIGAGGMLLLTVLGMTMPIGVDIPLGVWMLSYSILSFIFYGAGLAGVVMGTVVATRSRRSRRSGCVAVAVVAGTWLLLSLFGIFRGVLMILGGH